MRRLAWRAAHPGFKATDAEVASILAAGLALLEQVRAENSQMRAAYYAATKPVAG